ncbi:MAG TPA: glycosyltransferase [Nocardioides sp.]|uniref:glycosyltransferase n=1 Tax=Nocardioides sp. TaxID=35761 RepID=UPI002EDB059D
MRFAIVTPVWNGESLITDTVKSIVSQEGLDDGRVEIDYIVQDGASTDETVAAALASGRGRVRVASVPDAGMYDALAKGFRAVHGDVFFYLNAGDMLQPRALLRLADVFNHGGIDWVCGLQLFYSESGEIVSSRLPFRYRRSFLERGYYWRGLPGIQQESTFWSAAAMRTVDLAQLATFRLAGDFYLWHRINQHFELHVAQVALGGFRYHGNHLSSAMDEYLEEIDSIAGRLRFVDRFLMLPERVRWKLPDKLRRHWRPPLFAYSPQDARWQLL